MVFTTSNDFIKRDILIKYEGLEADKGEIPIEDLIDSLVGWRDFVYLSSTIFLKDEFSLKPLEDNQKPHVNVRALNKGSFEVRLELILALASFALAIKNDEHVKKYLPKLGKWINDLFCKYVIEKKALHTSAEVANELIKFARDYINKVIDDIEQAQKFAYEIDRALKKATKPVNRSVETIHVLSTGYDIDIRVSRVEKQAIHNYFYFKKEKENLFNARVVLNSINLRTKHAGLWVHECNEKAFQSLQKGYIRSDSIKSPKSSFTWSLHNQEPIDIWVEPVRNQDTGEIEKWHFYEEQPDDSSPLLEGLGDLKI